MRISIPIDLSSRPFIPLMLGVYFSDLSVFSTHHSLSVTFFTLVFHPKPFFYSAKSGVGLLERMKNGSGVYYDPYVCLL